MVNVESGAKVNEVAAGTTEVKDALALATAAVSGVALSVDIIDTTKISYFAGGLGTEASPYLIATAEQFAKINDLYMDIEYYVKPNGEVQNKRLQKYTGTVYNFKLVSDISLVANPYGVNSEVLKAFTGTLDGNGHKIILSEPKAGPKKEFYSLIGVVFGNVVLKNFDVFFVDGAKYTIIYINDYLVKGEGTDNIPLDATLENIATYSDKIVNVNLGNYSPFWLNSCQNFKSVKFINCENNVSIANSGQSTGVFTSGGWYTNDSDSDYYIKEDISVLFKDCKNNANI